MPDPIILKVNIHVILINGRPLNVKNQLAPHKDSHLPPHDPPPALGVLINMNHME